jgi:hypothetical protein
LGLLPLVAHVEESWATGRLFMDSYGAGTGQQLAIRVEETELNYSLDVILIDALIGMLALASIAGIALLLGGFSFFTPWPIAYPLMMFTAGLLRSRSEGSIWLK